GAPVLEGYPGAVFVGRSAEEGEFKNSEIDQLMKVVRQLDDRGASARSSRRATQAVSESPMHDRPPVYFVVVDHHLHPRLAGAEWSGLDNRLREQMVDFARR